MKRPKKRTLSVSAETVAERRADRTRGQIVRLGSRTFTAHLADDEHPSRTACGESWEPWQEPWQESEEPPDYEALEINEREAMRTEREYREARRTLSPRPHLDHIRQCQACLRVAMVGR